MEKKKVNINFQLDAILFIIFLILKLDGIIDWKWVWVFSPFWITWAIQICIWIVAVIAKGIAKWKWNCSITRPYVSGPRLVWDSKTNTLYGPCSAENNETEEE